MPLLGCPFDYISQPAQRPLAITLLALDVQNSKSLRSSITPPITRRPAPRRNMRSIVSAVGCIGLFGRDATLKHRAARATHHQPLAPITREPHHAPPARRNLFFTRDSTSNLSSSQPAISRRTPGITRRVARLRNLRIVVSAVGCMPLLCGPFDSISQPAPRPFAITHPASEEQ
jgi:hypothetical protein